MTGIVVDVLDHEAFFLAGGQREFQGPGDVSTERRASFRRPLNRRNPNRLPDLFHHLLG